MRRVLLLLLVGSAVAEEPRPAWVAANFVGNPPPALMRSREGWLRWTGLWGTRRLQHGSLVSRVAVSPDGTWIASACWDGTVKLWEARTGREIRTLEVGQEVFGLAISPSGKRIYTGDLLGAIRVWDVTTGILLKSWQLRTELWGLALSPDGKLLAHWGRGGFDLSDAFTFGFASREWAQTGGWSEPVDGLAFTPDGSRVVIRGDDSVIRIWEVATGAMTSLAGPEDAASSFGTVAVDPRGEEVAASWGSGEILRWTLKGGEPLPAFKEEDQVPVLVFSPDGKHVATACGDSIRLRDRATGESLREWWANDSVSSIAFGPDGSWLVSGGEDGAVRVWDTGTGAERLGSERLPELTGLAVSEDGTWAATAHFTEARTWNATEGTVLRRVTREHHTTGSVAITRDAHVVSDWTIDQQSPHGGTTSRRTITVWDRLTGNELRVLDGENGYGDIAIDPKGRWIVVPCEDGIQLWDVESGRKLRGLRPLAGNPVAVSRDGTRVVAMDRESRMHVWDAEGGAATVTTGQLPKIHASCCSPDGSRIAGASDDGAVRLWSTSDGAEVGVLRGHASAVKAITWSDDGRWILSGGEDGFVRVWDAATGNEADLIRVDGMPLVLVLGKDRLYVGCWNRTVCIYEWTPPE